MTTPQTVRKSAAHGSAAGLDAAGRAAADAVAGVDGDASVLFAFPSGLDPDRAAREIADAAPGTPVAGMTGNGSIAADGPIEVGCSALAFGSDTPVGIGVARGAGRALPRAARLAVTEAIAETPGGPTLIVLLLDTRSGDQADAVRGAYAAAGPTIPLVGGAAGGSEPAQIAGRLAHTDSVVAVGIGGTDRVGIGLADGCRPRGIPAIATRTSGRVLLELDGRPAAEVYLERLGYRGAELGDEEFEALAVTHPLAQPELSGRSRLRHVLRRGPERSLECATHIPVNAAIEFTHQSPDDIVAASGRAVRESLRGSGRPSPRAALIFDCAGRKRAVAGALDAEVAELFSGFGRDGPPPLAGLFSHGEICRVRGAKGDRNHAVVVASFG